MSSPRSFPKALSGSWLPNPNSSAQKVATAADSNLPLQSYLSLISSAVTEFASGILLIEMPNSSPSFYVNSSVFPYQKRVLDLSKCL